MYLLFKFLYHPLPSLYPPYTHSYPTCLGLCGVSSSLHALTQPQFLPTSNYLLRPGWRRVYKQLFATDLREKRRKKNLKKVLTFEFMDHVHWSDSLVRMLESTLDVCVEVTQDAETIRSTWVQEKITSSCEWSLQKQTVRWQITQNKEV